MALKSQGVILKRAGTEVAEITGITGPDGESNEIDVTHLRSVQKEYLTGLADAGNLSFTGWWNPTDPAQLAMRNDRLNQTSASYTVTLTDTPPTILTVTAFVKQFGMAIAPDGAIALNGSLRITGAEVWS
jgi:Lambda phage tail tube protein, TTP